MLSMTALEDHSVKCTNVLRFDLDGQEIQPWTH